MYKEFLTNIVVWVSLYMSPTIEWERTRKVKEISYSGAASDRREWSRLQGVVTLRVWRKLEANNS